MSKKKQFKGTSRARSFFDRKVQTYGYSRTLAMGKVLPKGWTYVRIRKIKEGEDFVTVKITKLLGGGNNARIKNANPPSK